MSMPPENGLSRRRFIAQASRAALGGSLLGLAGISEAAEPRDPYTPFRMGMQSYSLRAFGRDEMLDMVRDLGLRYLEAFGTHFPQTEETAAIAEQRVALKARGLRLTDYGVVPFGGDQAANRALFAYAKAMRIGTLSADPAPESCDQLDELVEEFDINIAIHNHGPGSRYDKIQSVLEAVADRNTRMGACIDTGHFIRSDEDPVAAIRALGRRVHSLHVKDVTAEKQFTEVGKGVLDLVGMLQALLDVEFRGVMHLEYEEHAEAPLPYIEECLAAIRKGVARVRPLRKPHPRELWPGWPSPSQDG